MAGFFVKPNAKGHARSISLPTRSHPTTLKIEQELNNLRNLIDISSSSSSTCKLKAVDKLCVAISGLADLYKSVGDLLKLPLTKQALAKHQDSRWVEDLLQDSVSFLDVCGKIRENLSLLTSNLRNLQSGLRRRNTNGSGSGSGPDNDLVDYVNSLKSFKREMTKSLVSLKCNVENETSSFPKSNLCIITNNNNTHFIAVLRVLREMSFVSTLVFRSVLGLFSATAALQPKTSKWQMVLIKFGGKLHVDDNEELNELEKIENSFNRLMVRRLNKDSTGILMQSTCMSLESIENRIQGVDRVVECLFRQLIHVRVSLLNILSDH